MRAVVTAAQAVEEAVADAPQTNTQTADDFMPEEEQQEGTTGARKLTDAEKKDLRKKKEQMRQREKKKRQKAKKKAQTQTQAQAPEEEAVAGGASDGAEME